MIGEFLEFLGVSCGFPFFDFQPLKASLAFPSPPDRKVYDTSSLSNSLSQMATLTFLKFDEQHMEPLTLYLTETKDTERTLLIAVS